VVFVEAYHVFLFSYGVSGLKNSVWFDSLWEGCSHDPCIHTACETLKSLYIKTENCISNHSPCVRSEWVYSYNVVH
jgi:hypothetical protein